MGSALQSADDGPRMTTTSTTSDSGYPWATRRSPALEAWLAPGARVATFTIVGRIGAGGAAQVYEAMFGDQRVALKLPRPTSRPTSRRERAQRLEREARVMRKLDSPHIVRLLASGNHEGAPYLVMELLEGETLSERLERGPDLDVDEVVALGAHLLDGVAHMHEAGFLHRDIKPSNVFLPHDRHAMLLDLGLAVGAAPDASDVTEAGRFVGTLDYCAPERLVPILGYDHRVDLYSVAATLYRALTRRHLFAARANALVEAILQDAPVPASTLRADVPPALDEVLQRALEKRPNHRYESADEMRLALLASR